MLTLLLALAFAQPPAPPVPPAVEPPVEIAAPAAPSKYGKLILTAKTKAKAVTWRVPAGVDTDPPAAADGSVVLDAAGRLAVWAAPGAYTFTAMVCVDGVIAYAEKSVQVGATPPGPPPGPPPANDKLRLDIFALLTAETGADKAANVKALASLYRSAAAIAGKRETIDTAQQLQDAVRLTASSTLPSTEVLKAIRVRVADALHEALPNLAAQLTDADRLKAADIYARAAAALESP